MFEDNGYVHNPVKILFPNDGRKKNTLILQLYNELAPKHLLRFHRKLTDKELEEVEALHILDTLRRCKNNQAHAARKLGIGRNTLWRKLKKIKAQLQLPNP